MIQILWSDKKKVKDLIYKKKKKIVVNLKCKSTERDKYKKYFFLLFETILDKDYILVSYEIIRSTKKMVFFVCYFNYIKF